MGSETAAWLKHTSVCGTIDDTSWYVCYDDKVHRLRLTMRGTWSRDDMDIYFRTKGEAFAALHVAPCPLEDPYARIAELESIVKNFDAFMAALAAIGPHAGKPDSHIEALLDKVKRVTELESTERELREAVNVLATDLRSYIEDQAVGDWRQNISEEVLDNPIASAAVMEAAK